ncbi:transposable element Tc1 transposase [Trichonephila clavipes]|nr:transposable element Tc1 transposase [Trichonephila clavipes]
MAAVDFLHHENPQTLAGVKPATLGAEGQRQTNHAIQPAASRLSAIKLPHYGKRGSKSSSVAFRRCDALGRWTDGGWTNYSGCETLDALQEEEESAPSAVSALVFAISFLSLVSLCAALFIFTAFRSLECARVRVHRQLVLSLLAHALLLMVIASAGLHPGPGALLRNTRPDHRDANCRLVDASCCWPGVSFGVWCAVRNCCEQWTREGTHARKTGSGATRKTTRREDRRIVRQALVDPTVTRSTIRADVGVAIVPQTISRHLAEANLKSKRPFRALPLTPEHRQLRLQWCQARSMWNVTDWQEVVFSDESRFVWGTDDNRVRVWRRPGELYNFPHIVLRHTARTAGVMVWGS